MKEKGRRKKEEGRRKKEGGLYMWIQNPNSKRATCVLIGVLNQNSADNIQSLLHN
jgi:hypothetical protein